MLAALLLGLVQCLRAAALWSRGDDSFEAMAAGSTAGLGFACLWIGYLAHGRLAGWLRIALPALSLVAGGLLLLDFVGAFEIELLGNSGYNMQLLLPGAAMGLMAWIEAKGQQSVHWSLRAAFLVTALLAVITPVIGGILVLGGLAALGIFARRSRLASAPSGQVILGGLVILGLLAPLTVALTAAPTFEDREPQIEAPSNLAGGSVRLHIWKSLAPLAKGDETPFGTGQFQAAYPPLRSAAEIALTTGNHSIEAITEVEHAHNDSLTVLAENGRFAALLLLLASALFAWTCVRHILSPDADQRALAAGALSLLLASSFHGPLFSNLPAAAIASLLLGVWAGHRSAGRNTNRVARFQQALALPAGGFALAAALWSPIAIGDLDRVAPQATTDEAAAAIAKGELAFPLLAARARLVAKRHSAQDAAAWWNLALAMRPDSIEALIQSGHAALQQGQLLAAQKQWRKALDLDPAYPISRRNLERLGADLILAGHLHAGLQELAAHLDSPTTAAPFDQALQVAKLWQQARKHCAAGDYPAARSALAQAARTAGHGDEPRGGLGLEYAVLESLTGQVSTARQRIDALARSTTPAEFEALIAQLPNRLASAARLLLPSDSRSHL